MTASDKKILHFPGVGYYNKDNKDNKDNTAEQVGTPLSSGIAADAAHRTSSSLPDESHRCSTSGSGHSQAKPQCLLDESEPTPQEEDKPPKDLLKTDVVKRAIIQLFNNPNAVQKHKLKVRLNLDSKDGSENSVEFIANLTKDRRNFKKYLPEHSAEWFVEWSDSIVNELKEMGASPYRGKFHYNNGYSKEGPIYNQVENWSACVVWFHEPLRKWMASISIYDLELVVELDNNFLTDKQKSANVIGQCNWINPKFEIKHARPKTFSQRIAKS